MITVGGFTEDAEITLASVDHMSTAQDAAQHLWESIYGTTHVHGGVAHLIQPEARSDGAFAVRWDGGPPQWADAYVVGEGADALGFVAQAENGDTVVFSETD